MDCLETAVAIGCVGLSNPLEKKVILLWNRKSLLFQFKNHQGPHLGRNVEVLKAKLKLPNGIQRNINNFIFGHPLLTVRGFTVLRYRYKNFLHPQLNLKLF